MSSGQIIALYIAAAESKTQHMHTPSYLILISFYPEVEYMFFFGK